MAHSERPHAGPHPVLEGGGAVQGRGSLSASILGPAVYFPMNMDLGPDTNFKESCSSRKQPRRFVIHFFVQQELHIMLVINYLQRSSACAGPVRRGRAPGRGQCPTRPAACSGGQHSLRGHSLHKWPAAARKHHAQCSTAPTPRHGGELVTRADQKVAMCWAPASSHLHSDLDYAQTPWGENTVGNT